jgi:Tfp pilus assembly protein PilF
MNDGMLDDALKIFTVLAEYFPGDWQSFDSLGEVQLKLGQTERAAESFRRSLALDPANRNAIEKAVDRLTQMMEQIDAV